MLVVPPLVAMAVVFLAGLVSFGSAVTMLVAGGLGRRGAGIVGAALGSVLLLLVCFAVAMLVNLISSAVVVVMAREALAERQPSVGAAYGEVTARLGDVVVTSVLCALIIGVASIFLVIPGLVAAFFLMFALPAVLLDGAGPLDGLKRSASLVRDNVGRALGLVIGAMLASIVVWIASTILHVIPVIGHLVSIPLAGVFFAYLTVVAVRVFQTLLRGRPRPISTL